MSRSSEGPQRAGGQDLCDDFAPRREKTAHLKGKLLEVAGLSEVFKALGDETRTRIIYLLAQDELCVCDLAELLEISLPAVSHHLRLLKALRLVRYRREGKMVFYTLDDDHIINLIRQAQEHFAEGR